MALESALSVLGGPAPADIPDTVLDNLKQTESSGDAYAVNKDTGAMGAYQFLPSTVAMLHKQGIQFDPFNEQEARGAAKTYLTQLTAQNGGDLSKAVAQYGGFKTKDASGYVAKVLGQNPTSSSPSPAAPQQAANEPLTFSGALAALDSPESQPSLADQIPGQARAPAQEAPVSTYDRLVKGPIQAGAALATGAVAQPLGALAGLWHGLTSGKYGTAQGAQDAAQHAQDVAESLTYQPRSQAGQETLGAVANAVDASKIAGMGPTEAITLGGASAMPLGTKWIGAGTKAAAPAAEVPAAGQMASVGAAGAKPADIAMASVANSSPELQATVAKTVQGLKPGQAVAQDVLDRHIAADALPVPINLMKGQATQDVGVLSEELNNRGRYPAIANRLNEQNQSLIANTSAIREAAAPDVYETSKPAVGQIPIDAYKAKDAALNADISAKYQALKDANGGQFPLDVKAFVTSANADLHQQLLFDHVPPAIKATMNRLSDSNSMTFENFESMRTNLARIQRSATADGNERAAAGVIRNALEQMPMSADATAAGLKPIADAARAAAKSRFDMIAADPAYKAVVNGKAIPDSFIQKYVVKAPLQDVQTMTQNLADQPLARQAIASGTVDHLRDAARIGNDNTGNFAQASFNNALDSLRPKLGTIFQPEQQQHIENLGATARAVKGMPSGSSVNTSNTAVTLMKEAAKNSAEGAVNVAAHGIPIGTWGRKIAGRISDARAVRGTLAPGAGILLKDLVK